MCEGTVVQVRGDGGLYQEGGNSVDNKRICSSDTKRVT